MKLTLKNNNEELTTSKSQFLNELDTDCTRLYLHEPGHSFYERSGGVRYVSKYNVYYAGKLLIEEDDQFSTLKEVGDTINRKAYS